MGSGNGDWPEEKKWVLAELERLPEVAADYEKRLTSLEVKVGVIVAKIALMSGGIAVVVGGVITFLAEVVFKK